MAREPIEIDRDKLRAEIRKLGNEYVFYMLDASKVNPTEVREAMDILFGLKTARFIAEARSSQSLGDE